MNPKVSDFLKTLCVALVIFETGAMAVFVFCVIVSRAGSGEWLLPMSWIAAVLFGFLTNVVVFLAGFCVAELHERACRMDNPQPARTPVTTRNAASALHLGDIGKPH